VAAPADLEALVRAELREPIAALVRRLLPELVAKQLNGHADPGTLIAAPAPERGEQPPRAAEAIPDRAETSAGLTTCPTCQVAQPPEGSSPGHTTCKACRRIQERDRARRKRAAAQVSESPG
jgi:hypothetical protein